MFMFYCGNGWSNTRCGWRARGGGKEEVGRGGGRLDQGDQGEAVTVIGKCLSGALEGAGEGQARAECCSWRGAESRIWSVS